MVSNSALAAVCIWAGLDEYLMFEAPVLAHNIRAYAQKLREKQKEEYALAQQEGRSPGQYWLETEPPKVSSSTPHDLFTASGPRPWVLHRVSQLCYTGRSLFALLMSRSVDGLFLRSRCCSRSF